MKQFVERGLDKLGHIYTSYVMSTFCGDVLMECGLDQTAAMWTGAGMGLIREILSEFGEKLRAEISMPDEAITGGATTL